MTHNAALDHSGDRDRPGAGRDEANLIGLFRAHWPSGLYYLHLHDNSRWIAGAKLVVE